MEEWKKDTRKEVVITDLEALVPQEHLLRKIEKVMDYDWLYERLSPYYCHDNGRPGTDPVVLIKMVLIQHLFGIPSLRQTYREIQVNLAYRWFLGYSLLDEIPHFATVSYAFCKRFPPELSEEIFAHILNKAINNRMVDSSAIFIDGTHIRANANKKKYVIEVVAVEAKRYQKELDEEINRDREEHGKKPLKNQKDDDEDNNGNGGATCGGETKEITGSTSDPECGLFHKGEHEKQFAYVAGTACDKRNFILGFSVAPGNTHDSVMFDDVYNKTVAYFPEVEAVVADSAYRTPWIAKKIMDDKRVPSLPYKRPMTPDGYFRKYEYVYDKYYDCIICPNNQVLKYSTTNREGYREYKSDPNICKNCPCREQCTRSKDCQKTVTRHVWEQYMEMVDDYRHTPWVKELYDMRKQKIERVFADAKVKHGLRYTHLRGLAKVTMQVTLTFACMNLKKLAKWKRRTSSPTSFFAPFLLFFQNVFSSIQKSVHTSAFAAG